MFDYDICLCGNADKCPNKDLCRRGQKHGPGIYTMALFYDEKNKQCDYFFPIIKKEKVEHENTD